MDPRSTRSILVRLGMALCLLGIGAGALTVAALAASPRQPFHDDALLLSGMAVVAGLLLLALGVVRTTRAERGARPELFHGPESSTLSFAPPSVGTFPERQRLPNIRRRK
ncbi:hypothetical protein PE066_06960 [Ramlibacter tataouinensis]|uniref:hypothetical protein n=1 Tax=Ramlibacter tataouinensis TaxID=94132 RepID=UPI0022F3EE7F|nr:hypothetical protein [Ramlibacter tataouinensis]WBY03267.1 hypothetical protein PE066_06960 [Ramlibacter tataouinensis]